MEIVLGKLIDAIVSAFRSRPILKISLVAIVLVLSIALIAAELSSKGTL